MPPVTSSLTVPREFNESVPLAFSNPYAPSAWSDTITTTVFGVAALITASISIWQTHRYLHSLTQLRQTQTEDFEKAIPAERISFGKPGFSVSKTASTISGETIRTTPDEFYGLEAQSPLRLSIEHEATRKSAIDKRPATPIGEPSNARVQPGPLPQIFLNHELGLYARPDYPATGLAKICELFFYISAEIGPNRPTDSHMGSSETVLREIRTAT